MSTIRVLAPAVADAIAAGEVVERPAAVVKELVENSLDAGARRVSIELRAAGRTLIRVVDDGAGIPTGELGLAFRRHATSKVAGLEDLERIRTLGFRGEALASIAAVADVRCRSGGAGLRVRAGAVVEQGVEMPAPGTVMEVRDLFAATPARLRFLKSDATEQAASVKVVHAYALVCPEVRFDLAVDGRSVLRTPGGGDRRAAAAAVMGAEVAAALIAVEADAVGGLISGPGTSRGSRDSIQVAVNHRPITSRSLLFAVEECYLGALEKGRHPVAVLDLTVDPAAVDVNVHPTKREVRFRDERWVFAAVQRAVRAALTETTAFRVALGPSPAAPTAAPVWSPLLHERARLAPSSDPDVAGAAGGGPLRPLGQVGPGYLVAESEVGLVLVDQHAAHERVLYNRIMADLERGVMIRQPLLLAETVELEPAQVGAATDHRERLQALGFTVEPFGPTAVRIAEGPAATPAGRLPEALRELLEVLVGGRPDDVMERAAAALACHSAVRFGDALDPSEQRRLLDELSATEPSLTCPHGRPTRLLLDWRDLRRHFRRNY